MEQSQPIKHKRKDKRPICKCSAYRFPHRKGSGVCESNVHGQTNGIFDMPDDPRRGEAREINRENNRSR